MARGSKKSIRIKPAGCILPLVIIGILIVIFFSKEETTTYSSQFPFEDYMVSSKSLRDNKYTISGQIENKHSTPKGDIITLIAKDANEKEWRLPLIITRGTSISNIERGQHYEINVQVRDMGSAQGLLQILSVKEL